MNLEYDNKFDVFQANIGNMDTYEEQWKMISGNIALTQVNRIFEKNTWDSSSKD